MGAAQTQDASLPDVSDVRLWYHTLELPGGVVTPGAFDLRPIVDKLPWPDVRGKRCLDVGTYDGFLAFEMERRGAKEVVATDISDHQLWDWPAAARARSRAGLEAMAGQKGLGFEVARRKLGSSVVKREINVYHLTPEEVGTFDVVVCGSLLLHLRDPVRALEAMRGVCEGWFMSSEEVSLGLSLRHPRVPVADARLSDAICQWWVVNTAGHRRLLEVAGFEVHQSSGLYVDHYGKAHPRPSRKPRELVKTLVRKATCGADGVPHHALLARPRLQAPPIVV